MVGQQIAAGITFEQANADALLSLAVQPDPVSADAVWIAVTDGRLE